MFSFPYLFICFVILFVFIHTIVVVIWKKMTFCKTTLISTHLIKVTILGRALWGTNTFPTRNRLPNPKLGS